MTENNPKPSGDYEWEVFYESNKAPGVTFYSGSKKIIADSDNEAIDKCYQLLRKTFNQRTRSCWNIYRVVQIA